jgi:hypothetical protein
MTDETKIQTGLHKALVAIRDKGPDDLTSGICHNVTLKCDCYAETLTVKILHRLRQLVRYYAGIVSSESSTFPIEGSYPGFYSNHRKWDKETEYGQKRWAMLNTLIDLNRSDQ